MKYTISQDASIWNDCPKTQPVSFPSIERLFISCFVIESQEIMLITEGDVIFFNSALIELAKLDVNDIDPSMD